MFLEPLIKFLAFLVQKLCQKYSKYARNSPSTFRGFPILIFYHFFHNSSTRNANNLGLGPGEVGQGGLEVLY